MKQIFNEGRVVGLSAYELYVRQLLASDPNAVPLGEREWLASTVSTNNSMLLRIAAGTSAGYHDYVLPEHSDLCACTIVIASLFEGDVSMGTDLYWGAEVGNYGKLIKNTYGDGNHPVSPGEPEDIPVDGDVTQHDEKYKRQVTEYNKIVSGLVLQPGNWVDNITYEPILTEEDENVLTQDYDMLLANVPFAGQAGAMALEPDLSRRGFVRIAFSEEVYEEFYILLHGFTMKAIMAGVQGFKNSFISTEPWNGDFLGPQLFPWAVEIVFMVSCSQNSAGLQAVYNKISSITESDVESEFASTDFNDYTQSGFYHIDDLSTYTNGPDVDITSGQLMISSNGPYVAQVLIGDGSSFSYRYIKNRVPEAWRSYDSLDNQLSSLWNMYGAKNLIKYPYYQGGSQTISNVVFTINNDGTMTARGTASAAVTFYLVASSQNYYIPSGQYYFSGLSGGSSSTYWAVITNGSNVYNLFDSDDKLITISESSPIQITIRIAAGYEANLSFNPMLRSRYITDTTYQPFAKTNRQLTKDIDSILTRLG